VSECLCEGRSRSSFVEAIGVDAVVVDPVGVLEKERSYQKKKKKES
jgi:hypothetical protein